MAEAPNLDEMEKLFSRKADGPVTMLNLLKFKPDGGRERYAEYGTAVAPLLEKVGGRPVFVGSGQERLIGDASGDWDMVLLVEYPTRQAFLDMVTSQEYQAIAHLRDEAIGRSVLLALDPAPAPTVAG